MECKGHYTGLAEKAYYVLIETLWNVKVKNITGDRRLHRFNRNIVECKDNIGSGIAESIRVLIETLWNVKTVLSEKALFQNPF